MIVVHIESGLGNQMLSYCELLAARKTNPTQEVFIETLVYDIPECDKTIRQWNGYELENVFQIHECNIRDRFTPTEWKNIIAEVKNTEFWAKNWNYPVYITSVLNRHGFRLENIRGDFEAPNTWLMTSESQSWKSKLKKTYIGYYLKRLQKWITYRTDLKNIDETASTYLKTDSDIFTGQRLCFKFKHNQIENIEEEIRQSFQFPEIRDGSSIYFGRKIHWQ